MCFRWLNLQFRRLDVCIGCYACVRRPGSSCAIRQALRALPTAALAVARRGEACPRGAIAASVCAPMPIAMNAPVVPRRLADECWLRGDAVSCRLVQGKPVFVAMRVRLHRRDGRGKEVSSLKRPSTRAAAGSYRAALLWLSDPAFRCRHALHRRGGATRQCRRSNGHHRSHCRSRHGQWPSA
jgi:hypothetical protein